MAWHIFYKDEGEIWQFDVIHIEEGTEYDGYFERMADRILEVMSPVQRNLRITGYPEYAAHSR